MPFITFGSDSAPSRDERTSLVSKLVMGAVLAGTAVIVFRASHPTREAGLRSREVFLREWPMDETTMEIPRESMSHVVAKRLR